MAFTLYSLYTYIQYKNIPRTNDFRFKKRDSIRVEFDPVCARRISLDSSSDVRRRDLLGMRITGNVDV